MEQVMTKSPFSILDLEKDWDTYGGLPVDPVTFAKAYAIGESIAHHFPSARPSYTPLSSGDVQVEWHCDGWDVEICVERHHGVPQT